ncbi:glycerophosphodiester phosphodiesterase family protein [Tahibacter amnicola]|uniref:glycerophosphodiester phosphodiesterase n=1 Tax=Tahibacter amnicola TaxID=2976241 RepID=A0ABY6BBF7_9GAMM|nr:glycerophosphodiester phosphodiesterase family protein [Tahibacter amnicola]UXI67142.1 glycerophosphodiester phosphodiesterase family protein [Tahibacter amnicola]
MSRPIPVARPRVIAHRGASAYLPEHTLAAYARAIDQGADIIEPDLVVTSDGVLIARHENELGGTTDVATRPEFANRRCTKRIDGSDVTGWFAEDFTLADIKSLRARERIPEIRPDSAAHDGEFAIPTFAEVIDLARRSRRPVAIYPETKHPTYFAEEGRHRDGRPIARSLGRLLLDDLARADFLLADRVLIQSFEVANLLELRHTLMPSFDVQLPLMQLFDNVCAAQARIQSPKPPPAGPYDVRFYAECGDDLEKRYPGLAAAVGKPLGAETAFADLAAPRALAWMREHYATGIAPWKNNLLQIDANGVHPTTLGIDARAAGLQLHTYTLRGERHFLRQHADGTVLPMEEEIAHLLDAGVDAFFCDHPDRGVMARDRWMGRRSPA